MLDTFIPWAKPVEFVVPMTAIGRVQSLAFTLVISPLSSAKQPFRKHKSNVYEGRLSANCGHSDSL
jgi:hypothetical protein